MSVRVCVCVLRQGLRQPRLRTENKSLARETKVDAELRRRFPERLLNDKVRVCEHYTVTSYCSLNVTACELFFSFSLSPLLSRDQLAAGPGDMRQMVSLSCACLPWSAWTQCTKSLGIVSGLIIRRCPCHFHLMFIFVWQFCFVQDRSWTVFENQVLIGI